MYIFIIGWSRTQLATRYNPKPSMKKKIVSSPRLVLPTFSAKKSVAAVAACAAKKLYNKVQTHSLAKIRENDGQNMQ